MLFHIIALLIIVILIFLTIKNTIEAKKLFYSRMIYMDIKKVNYLFDNNFKDIKNKYSLLTKKIEALEELIKDDYIFPYNKIKLNLNISSLNLIYKIKEIYIMIDERNEIIKDGLPDLYNEIIKINNQIMKTYFPLKTIIIKLYFALILGLIKIKKGDLLFNEISNETLVNTKYKPKDIVKFKTLNDFFF